MLYQLNFNHACQFIVELPQLLVSFNFGLFMILLSYRRKNLWNGEMIFVLLTETYDREKSPIRQVYSVMSARIGRCLKYVFTVELRPSIV